MPARSLPIARGPSEAHQSVRTTLRRKSMSRWYGCTSPPTPRRTPPEQPLSLRSTRRVAFGREKEREYGGGFVSGLDPNVRDCKSGLQKCHLTGKIVISIMLELWGTWGIIPWALGQRIRADGLGQRIRADRSRNEYCVHKRTAKRGIVLSGENLI